MGEERWRRREEREGGRVRREEKAIYDEGVHWLRAGKCVGRMYELVISV